MYDVVGNGRHQSVAPGAIQIPAFFGHSQQDLQVHFPVGAMDASGVVDEVGVDPTAGQSRTRSDPAG